MGYGHRHSGYGSARLGYGYGGIGVDITDGDLVDNLGDGIGVDVDPFSPDFGDLEVEIAPGIDVPIQDDPFMIF